MADPIELFSDWQRQAAEAGVTLPDAMTLATSDAEGRPSARTVLLKGLDERGFVFFTNYESRKARQLEANPEAALVFLWHTNPRRQVLVTGSVERVPRAESEAYFATRDAGSRLGAWASRQSSPLESRAELERAYADAEDRFGEDVPLPEWWGGYILR
ncbi:MAG TPA: pyridoxamine 5'-phosphate oxidase, partial [Gaiellaceae bacterium]|nr:pyridoxamine 5'-phosphate oxidase [Gaiellaceae bacterium]